MGAGWESILGQASFVAARVGGLMTFAPFFGSSVVPLRVKAGLMVALTAVLLPVLGPQPVPLGVANWAMVVLSEVVVGLLLGLALHFVFDGVQLAGQVVGFQLGYSLVNLIDPHTQVETPVLSNFYQIVALLIFLQLDFHHWLLRGLARSFAYLPPGAAGATPAVVSELLPLAGGMWLVAVQIAAPALLATLLTDVALGFLGKAAPQLPVLFVGLSVKSVVGYAVMLGAVAFWPGVLSKHFLRALEGAERLLRLAG